MPFPDDWTETILPVKEKYDLDDLTYSTLMLQAACQRANVGCTTTPQETFKWREEGLVIDYQNKKDPTRRVTTVFLDKTYTKMKGWRLAWYAHTFDDDTMLKEVLRGAVALLTKRLHTGEIKSQEACERVYMCAKATDETPHADIIRSLPGELAKEAEATDRGAVMTEDVPLKEDSVAQITVEFDNPVAKPEQETPQRDVAEDGDVGLRTP